MVVQRTLAKIEELKERPHHERRSIALYGAIAVMVLLTVSWGFFAVRAVGKTAIELTRQQNEAPLSSQTASAAGTGELEANSAPAPLTASSTDGYVDLVPSQSGL